MKDYFGYQGKVCVVTGAASGMGKAAAEMLVELGADVYGLDWSEVNIKGLGSYIHTDLSKKDSIDDAFKKIPLHIDSYFGIAGVSGNKTDFITTVTIDFLSNKYICEEFLSKRMERGGSIAFITSTGGIGWEREENKKVYMPVVQAESWKDTEDVIRNSVLSYLPGTLAYPFSKLALNYYVMKAQNTFAPKGIRINAVLPGSTETGLTDEFSMMAGGEENLLSHTGYAKRFAAPKEMAEPIVFMNSDMASYISGELLNVDYGYSSGKCAGMMEGQCVNLSAVVEQIQKRMAGR